MNLTRRDVDAEFAITQVQIDLLADGYWLYTLTAQETTTYQGNYLDRWDELLGGGSGSSGVTVASAASSGVSVDAMDRWLVLNLIETL